MIGDRVDTDILGAMNAGLAASVLVEPLRTHHLQDVNTTTHLRAMNYNNNPSPAAMRTANATYQSRKKSQYSRSAKENAAVLTCSSVEPRKKHNSGGSRYSNENNLSRNLLVRPSAPENANNYKYSLEFDNLTNTSLPSVAMQQINYVTKEVTTDREEKKNVDKFDRSVGEENKCPMSCNCVEANSCTNRDWVASCVLGRPPSSVTSGIKQTPLVVAARASPDYIISSVFQLPKILEKIIQEH